MLYSVCTGCFDGRWPVSGKICSNPRWSCGSGVMIGWVRWTQLRRDDYGVMTLAGWQAGSPSPGLAQAEANQRHQWKFRPGAACTKASISGVLSSQQSIVNSQSSGGNNLPFLNLHINPLSSIPSPQNPPWASPSRRLREAALLALMRLRSGSRHFTSPPLPLPSFPHQAI
jgi:hypothetical protein